MGKFDYNFKNQTEKLLPPTKRLSKFKAWMYAVTYPLQWLHVNVFTRYRLGVSDSAWNNSTIYERYDLAVWLDGSAWEAQETTAAGESPATTPGKWMKIVDSFVGSDERVTFTGQKLVLEYALNRFLRTEFVQPDYATPLIRSEIYIDNVENNGNAFLVGQFSSSTSYVSDTSENAIDFIGEDYDGDGVNLIVYYPVAFTSGQIERLKSHTEKYLLYGISASYQSY